MALANADTAGFAPAKFDGRDIPEIAVASGALGSTDCHFGISGDVSSLVADKRLRRLGPRAIDVSTRGGILAEALWFEFRKNPSSPSMSLQAFITTFDDIGCSKAIAPGKNVYSPGAMISGTDVSGQEKYKPLMTHKTMTSITEEDELGSEFQKGARWSKVAIENTIRNNGIIHFHLDGMGNVHEIINSQGDFSHNVTSRELRYIYRNRGRPNLMNSVVFYNGYRTSGSGAHEAVTVHCPWN